jgi:hypothetical protein
MHEGRHRMRLLTANNIEDEDENDKNPLCLGDPRARLL